MTVSESTPKAQTVPSRDAHHKEKLVAQPVPTREFTSQEKLIRDEIRKQFPSADHFRFDRIGTGFIDGNTYMVEFNTPEIKNPANSWFYAYVDSTECRLFNTGDEAVVFMQDLLEKEGAFYKG